MADGAYKDSNAIRVTAPWKPSRSPRAISYFSLPIGDKLNQNLICQVNELEGVEGVEEVESSK
jgi:hypothetical protein